MNEAGPESEVWVGGLQLLLLQCYNILTNCCSLTTLNQKFKKFKISVLVSMSIKNGPKMSNHNSQTPVSRKDGPERSGDIYMGVVLGSERIRLPKIQAQPLYPARDHEV